MFKKIWKTFCNTDVIGKIYMLIIFFIVIVSIITVIVRYTIVGKKEEQQVNEDVIDVIESPQENITDDESTTSIEENSNSAEGVVETNQEVKTTENVFLTPVIKGTNEEKKPITNNVGKTTTDNKLQEVMQTKEPAIENTNDKNNSQEADVPTNAPTPKPKEEGAKYVVNNQMINKMKTYIENNPSEDMKNFGFTVVVTDNSIKELTNGFTYTEKRVKNLISLKFGTIRIYAEDYYYNDEYVTTYCYLI